MDDLVAQRCWLSLSAAFPQEYYVIIVADLFKAHFQQCVNLFRVVRHFDREFVASWLKEGSFNVDVDLSVLQTFLSKEQFDIIGIFSSVIFVAPVCAGTVANRSICT